jgi:hypothetical protein
VETVLGLPLPALEQAWLDEEVFTDPAAERWRYLAPWLVLAALVLVGPLLFFVLILPRGAARERPSATAP